MASCAFILVGDAQGAIGAEFASTRDGAYGIAWQQLEPLSSSAAMLVHANTCLLEHPDSADDQILLKDSPARVHRLKQLILECHANGIDEHGFGRFFQDEQGFPASINRKQQSGSEIESLFNIVITYGEDGRAKASVKMGRPTEDGEVFELSFLQNSK